MKMNMPVDAETHAAFQQQAEQQQAKQEQQAEQEEKRKSMLLSVLSPEARERLGRISTVKPEKARQVQMHHSSSPLLFSTPTMSEVDLVL